MRIHRSTVAVLASVVSLAVAEASRGRAPVPATRGEHRDDLDHHATARRAPGRQRAGHDEHGHDDVCDSTRPAGPAVRAGRVGTRGAITAGPDERGRRPADCSREALAPGREGGRLPFRPFVALVARGVRSR